MSRITLKGKAEGSEVVVGLDPPTGYWFLQYYPKGEDYESEEEGLFGPTQEIDTNRNSVILEAIEELADMEHPLTQFSYDRIAMDLDPGDPYVMNHYSLSEQVPKSAIQEMREHSKKNHAEFTERLRTMWRIHD